MITYKPLLKLLIDKRIKKSDLKVLAGIGPNTLAKLSKDEPIAMDVVDKLCQALDCQPGDILAYESSEEKPAE